MNGLGVSGEVTTAGTALAGFVLIYIGSVVAAFDRYQPQEQKTVKPRLIARAWLAFVGFVLASFSAALSIIGKWLGDCCSANVAVWFLLAAFLWSALTVILTIREIK